ncbi:hypothetical protein DIPPA_34276 [Diplonema papillatum]|nr:hypothetical protein DIPPA_34276 [Diplonema papillatum]
MASSRTETTRRVVKVFTAHAQKEGAGFTVQRPFPSKHLTDEQTDPFLMIDEIGPTDANVNNPGAPWHPHRGFDTVTYLKSGCAAHQDSLGNKGFMGPGEVQWMHTGSGIIHDEGPPKGMTQEELERYGKMHGFQIWINNPPAHKMTPPTYTHLTAKSFQWQPWGPNAKVKLFAGAMTSKGNGTLENAQMDLPAPVVVADALITAGGGSQATEFPIDAGMETCMVYVYGGEGRVHDGSSDAAGTVIKRQDVVFFAAPAGASQRNVRLRATDEQAGLHVLILAGKKIGAPVARHGPFVMNTEEEIRQAFKDYEGGKLASTKAKGSVI